VETNFSFGEYMSHLKEDFAREKGYSWDCNSSAHADYIEWLETKVEKFTSTNNTRDKILLCADKVFACKSYVSVCKANLGWCTSQRKTSPIA
jgi:hypothetical protein